MIGGLRYLVLMCKDTNLHVRDAGFEPIDHQQPGTILQGPVTRPWGDLEFELKDPDGHRWAFTQVKG